MAIPLPWTPLKYYTKLLFTLGVESNLQLKNSLAVISAFFGSIYLSGFLTPYLSLKFNVQTVLDPFNVIKFFLHNAIPISIIYAIIIYAVIFPMNKKLINMAILFIQGIKFFTVINIAIAITMTYFIDHLIIDGIKLSCHSLNEDVFSTMSLPMSTSLIIACTAIIFGLVWILIYPTFQFIYKFYSFRSKWIILLITLLSLVLINFLNRFLYTFYPNIETKEIIVAEKFCKEISELKILQNNECNLTKEDIMDFRQKCQDMINTTK